MKAITRILVPVDFSDPSLEAMDVAATLALQGGSSLDILYVDQDAGRHEIFKTIHFNPESIAECIRSLFHDRQDAALGGAAQRLRSPRVIVERGDPVEQILRTARHEQSDLIIMGTHGKTGFARTALGSVTEKVMRRATCPVLALRIPTGPVPRVWTGEEADKTEIYEYH